jgi:hypothetical protein
METTLLIDPEAKSRISLIKVPRDAAGKPFFIGKLQFPGTMEFEQGVSFMVFVAEEGVEELQIAPIDPARRNKTSRDGRCASLLNNARFSIDLHPMIDQNGSTYYVGEAIGLTKMDLRPGIFFTIFTSIAGQEQIQISRLQVKVRPRYDDTAPRSSPRATNTFDPKRYSETG